MKRIWERCLDFGTTEVTESLKDGNYEVFMPDGGTNGEKIPDLMKEAANAKINSRTPRIIQFILVPAVFIPLLNIDESVQKNIQQFPAVRMFGCLLFCMITGFFGHLLYLLFDRVYGLTKTSKKEKELKIINGENECHLYRVYCLHSVIPGWSPMSICYRSLLFKQLPMRSMSEFCSIQGGVARLMLKTIGSFTWVITISAIAFQIQTNQEHVGPSALLSITGSFGFTVTTIFELDPFNKNMQRIHRIGRFLMSFSVFGFLGQQINFLVHGVQIKYWYLHILPAIILVIIVIISLIYWVRAVIEGNKYVHNLKQLNQPEDKNTNKIHIKTKLITSLSAKSIIAEIIYQYCCMLSLCLALVNANWCFEVSKHGCT